MKHPDDNLTLELPVGAAVDDAQAAAAVAPPPVRTRGRPALHDGLTVKERNAARQQRHRDRLRDSGKVAVAFVLTAELAQALKAFTKFKDETPSQVVERIIRDRLLRKR